MIVPITLGKDTDPNVVGETILQLINPTERWGYMTRETSTGAKLVPLDKCPQLEQLYSYCENEPDTYRTYPSYYYLQLSTGDDFYIGLHWDGDGYITIHNIAEGWTVSNSDCKKSDYWSFEV